MSGNANKTEEFKFNLQDQNTKSSLQILRSINRIVKANGCQCHPKTQGCVLHCQKCMVKKIYESVKVLVAKSCPTLCELTMASVLNTLSSLPGLIFLDSFPSCFGLCLTCSSLSLSISTLTSFFWTLNVRHILSQSCSIEIIFCLWELSISAIGAFTSFASWNTG